MIAILNVDGKGRREVLAAVQNFLDLLLFVYLRPYTRFTFIGLDFQWPEEHSHVWLDSAFIAFRLRINKVSLN